MTIYTKSQCIEPFLEILVEFTSCVDFEIGVIFKLEAEANHIIGSLSYRLLSFNSYDGWLFRIDWIFNTFFTSNICTCKTIQIFTHSPVLKYRAAIFSWLDNHLDTYCRI